MPEQIIRQSELARELGVSRPVLSNWLRRGVLTPDLVSMDGGSYWYPSSLPALKKWYEIRLLEQSLTYINPRNTKRRNTAAYKSARTTV